MNYPCNLYIVCIKMIATVTQKQWKGTWCLTLCVSPPSLSSETGEAALRILSVSVEDSGVYTCVASNVAGSVTSCASLRVSGESPVRLGRSGLDFRYPYNNDILLLP